MSISTYEDFPKNELDYKLKAVIDKYPNSIKHLGKLNKTELYKLMEKSEYWLYPCSFDETSCITAMEMMSHEVLCLYYPRAGLTDTMNSHGFQISHGNELEVLFNLSETEKHESVIKAKEYSKECYWNYRSREWLKVIKKVVFIFTTDYKQELLKDYIASLPFSVVCTDSYEFIQSNISDFDEIVIVHELREPRIFDLGITVSYLNTEPLNLLPRLSYVLNNINVPFGNKIKYFYDYSMSNIHILNAYSIENTYFLEYSNNPVETKRLKQFYLDTTKEYDYGVICSGSVPTNDVALLEPPRRKRVVEYLLSAGFTVNIISGFGESRDRELSRCKTILNIHGQYETLPTIIFEHIRCNRLLYAGYEILSETSELVQKPFDFPNLKFIEYSSFFKLKKNYCFIHSCNNRGLYRLNNLLQKLQPIAEIFEKIFINNIGDPLPTTLGTHFTNVEITNYSPNKLLYEVPTINKIKQFAENNPDTNILYIHTKGVSYEDSYVEETDWINMMLYFLLKKESIKLLETFETLGCNYTENGRDFHPDGSTTLAPPHYSGNFWWARSDYLKNLEPIPKESFVKNDCEYWLMRNKPKYYELHHSGIDHYHSRYPPEIYSGPLAHTS